MAGPERNGLAALRFADAGDLRRLVAVEDRAVLGNGDLARRIRHRIEIRVTRAAVDGVEFGATHFEGNAQFDERLDAAQESAHVLAAGRRGDRIGPAELYVGSAPAQRTLEVDDATRRKHRAQRPAGFGLDFFPAGRCDGRAIAEKMILHFLFT